MRIEVARIAIFGYESVTPCIFNRFQKEVPDFISKADNALSVYMLNRKCT